MPFTPFHMGAGIFIKAILQGSFSLMIFGWSQIVMDVQPLWALVAGMGHLHGFSHTYIGCGVLAALSGKYLSELGLKILNIARAPITISWWVAFLSAFIGCFSHVFLDSIMHADVQPFYPVTLDNPFLGLISIRTLHKLCLYGGLIGAGLFYLIQWHQDKKYTASTKL